MQGSDLTDRNRFGAIRCESTVEVVNNPISRYGWSENSAISEFMKSQVYGCLQDEETKVWHFSPLQLTELFADGMDRKLIRSEVA